MDTREISRPRGWLSRLVLREDLNFLLTNRIPRRWATLTMGRFSRVRSRALTRASLWVWRKFSPDLDLSEAESQDYQSLHDVFVRRLRDGARPVNRDPQIVVSPCDAVVGAFGPIEDGTVYQAKGFPYSMDDLLQQEEIADKYRGGSFVTLRLRSSFYHRFHAPCAGSMHKIIYVSGDTWNVNPIALARVERLFCKNERAVLEIDTGRPETSITLVPIAAILVASIRLHCLPHPLDLRYRGPNAIPCESTFEKGDELGYFEHGSTIVVFAAAGLTLDDGMETGSQIRMGQPLFRLSEPVEDHRDLGAAAPIPPKHCDSPTDQEVDHDD